MKITQVPFLVAGQPRIKNWGPNMAYDVAACARLLAHCSDCTRLGVPQVKS